MKPYTQASPYFSPTQRNQILKRTARILKGEEMLTMGKAVREFEEQFAQYCGMRYGIATNSCTSALNVVFQELQLTAKDEVILPTQTFFANASSVWHCGAKIKLVDVNQDFMLTQEIIESAITPRTKAIVMVHFAGLISPDIFKIKALCEQKGIWLIEDCSHAHGALAKSQQGSLHKAGSIGDVGVFSFFSTKILTCGEGGMIVCNDTHLSNAYRARANRGLDPMAQGERFITFGDNYRMGEFNAILGLAGLESLESNLTYRNKLAQCYKHKLHALEQAGIVRFQAITEGFRHSFWRFIVFLPKHKVQEVIGALKERQINADAPYQPLLHQQPLIKSHQDRLLFVPSTPPTPQNHISLPIHSRLKLKDVHFIAQSLTQILKETRQ